MISELRATPDLEQLVNAREQADKVLQLGVQEMVQEQAEVSDLLLIEQQRLIAKYGPESPQAKTAAARLQVHEQMKVGIKIYADRLGVQTPEPAPDRFVVYGRVLNVAGEGLPNLSVAVVDEKSHVADQAVSDDQGAFELSISSANYGAPSSETIDVEAIRGSDEPLLLRLEISDRRKRKLYRDEEPFEVTAGFRVYREILLEKDPGVKKSTRRKR